MYIYLDFNVNTYTYVYTVVSLDQTNRSFLQKSPMKETI